MIKTIEDRAITHIRNHFEQEEGYCKPLSADKFYSNNHFEYEIKGDRNKNLSIKECVDEINPYLKNIIDNIKNLMYGKLN